MRLLKLTFKGGVHPPENKKLALKQAIEILPPPQFVVIPVQQHPGDPAKPIVMVGDRVKTGDKICEVKGDVSVPCHASISGKVRAIEPRPHPGGDEVLSIVIENDGNNEFSPTMTPIANYLAKDSEEMKLKIQQAGLVGMDGTAFPPHIKLSFQANKPIDTFILNGVECEPYLAADHRLMIERPNEILEGCRIIIKILGCKNSYIGIKKNRTEVIALLQKLINASGDKLTVIPLSVKYPHGAEQLLIKTITNRRLPADGSSMDVGCMVLNVATVKAIYDAVSANKPLYERVVTVSGRGIKQIKNLLVRIGTPFQNVVDFCGGITKDLVTIVNGGPMRGIAQSTLQVPVTKATSGILALTKRETKLSEPEPCIRCARCVDVCPMNLLPNTLVSLIAKKQSQQVYQYGLLDCIECGSCSYICPSKIRHIQFFKSGKMELLQSVTH